ncbi:hypothetical protein FRC00_008987 [Tulasnella sp. 408]|nr:hypothetical protein FRC00_008987 [Tulasnella sp. 408]
MTMSNVWTVRPLADTLELKSFCPGQFAWEGTQRLYVGQYLPIDTIAKDFINSDPKPRSEDMLCAYSKSDIHTLHGFRKVRMLDDFEWTLPNKPMFLVVKYRLPSQRDYEFGFKMDKKTTANPGAVEESDPSAVVARMLVNRGQDTSPVIRTKSLPPLPPPGPVRVNPSPLLTSPNNSVLGLVGLGKVKPVLPPIVSPGPKLRSGRGPTFTDAPSPRGSPPGYPVGRTSPTRSTTFDESGSAAPVERVPLLSR